MWASLRNARGLSIQAAIQSALSREPTSLSDGESIASAFGTIPAVGVRLARLTHAPGITLISRLTSRYPGRVPTTV